MGGNYRFDVYNERGEKLKKELSEDENTGEQKENSAVNLPPGKQLVGIYVMYTQYNGAGFKWVAVEVKGTSSGDEAAGDGPLSGHLTATLIVDGVEKPFNNVHFDIEKDKDKNKGSLLSMTFEDAAFVDQTEASRWMFQMAIWGFHGAGTYQITNASSLWCQWIEKGDTFRGIKQGTLTVKEWRGGDKFSGDFDLVLEKPLVGVSDSEKRSIKGSFSFKKE